MNLNLKSGNKCPEKSLLCIGLLLAVQLLITTVSAQTPKLTLNVKNQPLKEVLKSIEKQSKCYFTYNVSQINPQQKVSVSVSNAGIEETLSNLFADGKIKYEINNRVSVSAMTYCPDWLAALPLRS